MKASLHLSSLFCVDVVVKNILGNFCGEMVFSGLSFTTGIISAGLTLRYSESKYGISHDELLVV